MYTIRYNNITGKISNMSKFGSPPEKEGWSLLKLDDEWDTLFDEISSGKKDPDCVFVNVNLNPPAVVHRTQTSQQFDLNHMTEIHRLNKSKTQLDIDIGSENNIPYMEVRNNTNNDEKFYVYMTKKSNVNYLYQQFLCDEKTKRFDLLDIDPDLLYSGNFSLYYNKLFETEVYRIL